jgi:predicted nucleotidyltransferase
VRIAAELPLLSDVERSCLERYLDLLAEQLGASLLEIAVYGSVARGEPWPRGIPIRSDLDLMVVTSDPVPKELADELVDATMPLFLECGRQLGPVFKTPHELAHPETERAAEFVRQFRRDAIVVYPPPTSPRGTPVSLRSR